MTMGFSRNENLLENMLGADNPFGEPQSRIEAILQNMLGANNELVPPQSRNEELLLQILHNQQSAAQVGQSGASLYDYDGTPVAHFTPEEIASLTAFPTPPAHEGLIFEGWNWDIEDAKDYIAEYGFLTIGPMYKTASEKTEITIELEEGRLSPCLGLGVDGTVKIDWGDGSDEEELTGTSTATTVFTEIHNYAEPGKYVIKIDVPEGASAAINGSGAAGSYVGSFLLAKTRTAATTDADATENAVYLSSVKKIAMGPRLLILNAGLRRCYALSAVTIPSSVTSIGASAFYACNALSAVTIPSSVTSISSNAFAYCNALSAISISSSVTSISSSAFAYCYSLSAVTIPSSVTSIGASVFNGCRALSAISIPSSVTSIGASTFNGCYSLSAISIPSSVTSIGASAFNGCYGVKDFVILATTPPALADANAFGNIAADARIVVPWSEDHSVLAAYQAADVWSGLASIIVEAPEPA